MFSCMAQFSLSSSPLWARRHGTVPLVTDNTKNRRTSRDPLHGPFCTIIRAQRTSSDVFQMASPIDLTASDDDGKEPKDPLSTAFSISYGIFRYLVRMLCRQSRSHKDKAQSC